MRKSILTGTLVALVGFGLAGCGSNGDLGPGEEDETTSFEKVESLKDFAIPESVVVNGKDIYVSNVNSGQSGNPWTDNEGYISKITKDGLGSGSSTITSKKWVEGLKAPKGLYIVNDYLFVCDLDRIVVISLETGGISYTYQAPDGVTHLNDIVVDGDKKIGYVSDSETERIWKVTEDGDWTVLYEKEQSSSNQNGLYLDDNKLVMQGEVGKLKYIDLETLKVETITSSLCGDSNFRIDGITKQEDKYIVSDWEGKVCKVPSDGGMSETINIEQGNTADIYYSDSFEALFVPDFNQEIDIYQEKND